MKIGMTNHAQQRCKERGITSEDLCAAIFFGRELSRDAHSRTVRHGKLYVVLSVPGENVVTAFRRSSPKKTLKIRRQTKQRFQRENRHYPIF